MDRDLDEILKEVFVVEYKRKEEEVSPIIKQLNDNFFFKLRDLEMLEMNDWKALGLPINIFFVLKKKYEQAKSVGTTTQSLPEQTTQQQTQPQPQPVQQQSSQQQSSVSASATVQTISDDKMLEARSAKFMEKFTNSDGNKKKDRLLELYKQAQSQGLDIQSHTNSEKVNQSNTLQVSNEPSNEESLSTFAKGVLFRILENIEEESLTEASDFFKDLEFVIKNVVDHPGEEMYRKLNIDSGLFKRSFKKYKSAIELLSYLRFNTKTIQEKNYYVYESTNQFIEDSLNSINDFLIEKKYKVEQVQEFDPYKGQIVGLQANSTVNAKGKVEIKDYNEMVKEELERRKDIEKKSVKTERNPMIFILGGGQQEGALFEKLNKDFEEKNTKGNDYLTYAKDLIKTNKDSEQFKMKAKVDYNKLVDSKVYTCACIKFKFPNGNVLQANFALMETIGDIYTFLKEEIINDSIDDFYIFTTPPVKKYPNLNAKVHSEKLHPFTIMHIGFPKIHIADLNTYAYFKDEALRKYLINC